MNIGVAQIRVAILVFYKEKVSALLYLCPMLSLISKITPGHYMNLGDFDCLSFCKCSSIQDLSFVGGFG